MTWLCDLRGLEMPREYQTFYRHEEWIPWLSYEELRVWEDDECERSQVQERICTELGDDELHTV